MIISTHAFGMHGGGGRRRRRERLAGLPPEAMSPEAIDRTIRRERQEAVMASVMLITLATMLAVIGVLTYLICAGPEPEQKPAATQVDK